MDSIGTAAIVVSVAALLRPVLEAAQVPRLTSYRRPATVTPSSRAPGRSTGSSYSTKVRLFRLPSAEVEARAARSKQKERKGLRTISP